MPLLSARCAFLPPARCSMSPNRAVLAWGAWSPGVLEVGRHCCCRHAHQTQLKALGGVRVQGAAIGGLLQQQQQSPWPHLPQGPWHPAGPPQSPPLPCLPPRPCSPKLTRREPLRTRMSWVPCLLADSRAPHIACTPHPPGLLHLYWFPHQASSKPAGALHLQAAAGPVPT